MDDFDGADGETRHECGGRYDVDAMRFGGRMPHELRRLLSQEQALHTEYGSRIVAEWPTAAQVELGKLRYALACAVPALLDELERLADRFNAVGA